MDLLMVFRKPFEALEEALEEAGCRLWRNREPGRRYAAAILDFAQAAKSPLATWQLKRALNASGAPLIALDRDAPWYKGLNRRRLWIFSALKPADIYASHSMQDAGRFAKQSLYLPNAAWLKHYHLGGVTLEKLRDPERYNYDASFLGNINVTRYPEHRQRMEFLHQLKSCLAEQGIKLEMFDSTGMPHAEQRRIIQSSRINLNVGAAADNAGVRSWGLPERCYGIPACGGFLLSDQRRHMADDFMPEEEATTFDGLKGCCERIAYFPAHPEQSRKIAEAAYARIMRDHTYANRAQALLGAISGVVHERR